MLIVDTGVLALIVGTGVLVAAADRTDRHHIRRAEIISDDPGPLVTTAIVMAEAAYLLERARTRYDCRSIPLHLGHRRRSVC